MLNKIDHIVVLMLENRSFDSVAGRLYDSLNPPPFHQVPRNQAFDGLSGKSLSNPLTVSKGAANHIPVSVARSMSTPEVDPGETFEHVFMQLYGKRFTPKMDAWPETARMDGFVQDYQGMLRERKKPVDMDHSQKVMEGYTPDLLPVLSRLAYEYAICDQWFCSVPSQTWANRSFVHAASSNGWVDNAPYVNWLVENRSETIFNRILARKRADLSWRVYYDKLNILPPLTLLIHFPRLASYRKTHFWGMEQFKKDAKDGKLPSYAFIEPRYFVQPNDQHPPHNVLHGEKLIWEVYQAVRTGKNWERTLLIITYDEHGGCYDHVAPPKAVPPTVDRMAGQYGFLFDRLGVRVCSVLISPYIEKGTVFRAKQLIEGVEEEVPLDHTSIIKTITNRWELGSLTERDKAASDLSQVLTRAEPREDCPLLDPLRPIVTIPSNLPLNDLQQGVIKALAAYCGTTLPEMSNVSEALVHLERLASKLDFLK